MVLETAATIFAGLTLAGILWLLRAANTTATDVAVIRALSERNQIDMERMRNSVHELRDTLQEFETRLTLVEERLRMTRVGWQHERKTDAEKKE